jgi:DNA-binding GntR family transcriptional regulator
VIQPVRRPPLWESVLEQLRAAILSGELRPGEKLVEVDLAERFGTSRGPIRQAVRELVREGTVIEFARRGHVVSSLSARDLAEVYGVREALEVATVKTILGRVSDDDLAGLAGHLDGLEGDEGDYLTRSVHDLAFHRALVALTGNARMSAINDQMLTLTGHLLRTAAAANPTLQTTIRPSVHRDVVAAIAARNADAAVDAVTRHYRHAEERLYPGLIART